MTTVLSPGAAPSGLRRSAPAISPDVRRAATVAFAVYLVALAAAVFLPLPDVRSITGGRADVGINLDLSRPDLLRSWEATRNVLMTIPFGLLLPLVVRWRYEWLVAACLGVPLVIETTQLLGSLAAGWAWRAFDVDDIFLNTVGGLLGLAATGLALALRHRSLRSRMPGTAGPRLPVHRLVPGALAAGVVGWAIVSTFTTPTNAPVVYACDELPMATVTELPGGASAYAGSDGSLCIRTPDGATSSLPRDVGPGPVLTYDADGGTFEIGVAPVGRPGRATDSSGRPVQAAAVEGAELAVWERPVA